MNRTNLLFFAGSVVAVAAITACSGGTVDVGATDSTNEKLEKTADGGPTGDGKTCTWGPGSKDPGTGSGSGAGSAPGSPGSTPGSAGSGSPGSKDDGTGTTGSGGDGLTGSDGTSETPTVYNVGDTFPSPDGCNICKCAPDGIYCTAMACADGGPAPGVCVVDGKTYKTGDTFKDSDGCNTCTCGADGNAECTLLGCVSK